MKILVILERPWQVSCFLRCLRSRRELKTSDFFIFSPDKKSQALLRRRGLSYSAELDYASPEIYSGVTDRAYFIVRHWCKSFIHETPDLAKNGMLIPSLTELNATYFFVWILRTVSFVQNLLNDVKPDEIWTGKAADEPSLYFRGGRDDFLYGAVAADWGQQKGIPVQQFQEPFQACLKRSVLWCFRKISFTFGSVRVQGLLNLTHASWWDYGKAYLRDTVAAMAILAGHFAACFYPDDSRDTVLISSSESFMTPVLLELRRRNHHRLVHLRETFSPVQCISFLKSRMGFWAIPISKRFLRPKSVCESAKRLRRYWHTHADQILAEPLYEWRGYSFGRLLRRKYEFLFCHLFPDFLQLRNNLEKFFRKQRINRILVEEDVCAFNKTLIQTANSFKIPSVVVQHGSTGLEVGFVPLSATRLAAFGEAAKRRLIEWGVEKDRIVVTGNVLHDVISQAVPPSRERFYQKLGLDPHKKVLLLGMFPYRDYSMSDFPEVESYAINYFKLIGMAVSAMAEFPDYQLLIKLHPRDAHIEQCRQFVRKSTHVRIAVEKTGPAVYYLMHSDLVITVLSTLALDTLAFRKPLVVVDFSRKGEKNAQTFFSMKIPVVPENRDLLVKTLKEVLRREDLVPTEALAKDHLGPMDYQASKRVADLLSSLLPKDVPPAPCGNPIWKTVATPIGVRYSMDPL